MPLIKVRLRAVATVLILNRQARTSGIMTNDIKKYKFKSNIDLQIEVIALITLLASNKKHLFTRHCKLIDEELKLPTIPPERTFSKIIYTIFFACRQRETQTSFF